MTPDVLAAVERVEAWVDERTETLRTGWMGDAEALSVSLANLRAVASTAAQLRHELTVAQACIDEHRAEVWP